MPSAEPEAPVLPDRGSLAGCRYGGGLRHPRSIPFVWRAQSVSVQFLQPIKFSHPRTEKLLRLSAL